MIRLRPAGRDDSGACAHVLYEAFRDVASRHGFGPVFPTVDDAATVVGVFGRFPVIRGTVAEEDGRVHVGGTPRPMPRDGQVRALTLDDLPSAADLHARVHAVDRSCDQMDTAA